MSEYFQTTLCYAEVYAVGWMEAKLLDPWTLQGTDAPLSPYTSYKDLVILSVPHNHCYLINAPRCETDQKILDYRKNTETQIGTLLYGIFNVCSKGEDRSIPSS